MNRERRLSAAELFAQAIRLSAHVLARNKAQIAGQLLGRVQRKASDEIKPLRKDATKWNDGPWLRPVTGDLTPPGDPLLGTFGCHLNLVNALAVTPHVREAVSASSDHARRVCSYDFVHGGRGEGKVEICEKTRQVIDSRVLTIGSKPAIQHHCSILSASIGPHLHYGQAAIAGFEAEGLREIVTAPRSAIPDQHRVNRLARLFSQQYSFIEDSAVCCQISILLATDVKDNEIAGRFNLVQDLVIEFNPISWAIGDRRCAEAFAVERQNHFSSQAQRTGFRQRDQIGSTSRGANHSSRTPIFEHSPHARCYDGHVLERKPWLFRIVSIDAPTRCGNDHTRLFLNLMSHMTRMESLAKEGQENADSSRTMEEFVQPL
jgi:hypothetical protein